MAVVLYRPDPPDGPWLAVDEADGVPRPFDSGPEAAARFSSAMGPADRGRFEGGWDEERGQIMVGDYLGPVVDG